MKIKLRNEPLELYDYYWKKFGTVMVGFEDRDFARQDFSWKSEVLTEDEDHEALDGVIVRDSVWLRDGIMNFKAHTDMHYATEAWLLAELGYLDIRQPGAIWDNPLWGLKEQRRYYQKREQIIKTITENYLLLPRKGRSVKWDAEIYVCDDEWNFGIDDGTIQGPRDEKLVGFTISGTCKDVVKKCDKFLYSDECTDWMNGIFERQRTTPNLS